MYRCMYLRTHVWFDGIEKHGLMFAGFHQIIIHDKIELTHPNCV